MRKDTLYDIYDSALDVELITNKLYYLEKLNSNAGRIFLSFVKNGLIDEETIDSFMELAQDIDLCDMDKGNEEDLVNMINNTLMNDYVNSDDDFQCIVDNYSVLLDNQTIDSFFLDTEDEVNYYKLFIVRQFNRILSALGNENLEKLYIHDMCNIMNSYKEMLDDLKNTTSISNKDYNEKLKTRIKYFVDILSDQDIFELDDEKYSAIISVASKITNIEKLKLLKGIIKFNKNLDYSEFINVIDIDEAELSVTTINRILKEAKIEKIKGKNDMTIYLRRVDDPEKERNIIKKVLKPENNA